MKRKKSIQNLKLTDDQFRYLGNGLSRPECVLYLPDHTLVASDMKGCATKIFLNDGKQILLGNPSMTQASRMNVPNGIAYLGDKIIIANIADGTIESFNQNNHWEILFDSINGHPMGRVNFVLPDSKGNIWFTVSTRQNHWENAVKPGFSDGYIGVIHNGQISIVEDHLAFPNEIRFNEDESQLFCVETIGMRIIRFDVNDLLLSNKRTYGPEKLGLLAFPDGIRFDDHGNLWGTIIYQDRIFVITPDENVYFIYDNPNFTQEAENKMYQLFHDGLFDHDTFSKNRSKIAPLMTSLAFSTNETFNIYIGSLLGTSIATVSLDKDFCQ